MSWMVAPIAFMRTKPRMPKVEGMSQPIVCHAPGMPSLGQLTPLRKRKGTEVKTTSSMMFSL